MKTPNTPVWAFPVFLAGLLLLFVGERIIPDIAKLRMVLSGLGFVCIAAVTGLRWYVTASTDAQRKTSERTMAVLATTGLVAVIAYFMTADPFVDWIGVGHWTLASRQRFNAAMTAGWVIVLLGSVLPQIFGEIALLPMRRAEHVEWRRVKGAVFAGLTLAAAASYGALTVYIAGEMGIRADYSYFKTSKPSEPTVAMVQSMTDDLRVLAFFPPVNEVREEAASYLTDLQKRAPNVKLEMHDRLLAPALAKEARVTQDGVIVLMRGQQKESINLGTELKTAQVKLKQLDREFQKALSKVLRSRRTAYLTVGHGELNDTKVDADPTGRSARAVKDLLEMQNYSVRDLGLVQGLGKDIPDDATFVMALGPTEPFVPEEIAALQRYVTRGGHLLLALDPGGKANNDDLAAIAGLTYKPGVLCNAEYHGVRRRNDSDNAIIFSNRFSSHPSVTTLGRLGTRALLLVDAGSLDKKKDVDSSLKIDFAVKSLPNTWADLNGNFALDTPDESKGIFNVVAAVSGPVANTGGKDKDAKDKDVKDKDAKDKKGPDELRVLVVADVDALSDATLLNPATFNGNPQFVVDAFRWLGGEESFAGAVNTTEDVRIEHTRQKDKIYFYLTIFGAPALVLGLGLTLTRRSRRAREGRKA